MKTGYVDRYTISDCMKILWQNMHSNEERVVFDLGEHYHSIAKPQIYSIKDGFKLALLFIFLLLVVADFPSCDLVEGQLHQVLGRRNGNLVIMTPPRLDV
jgi:hypothetical protein